MPNSFRSTKSMKRLSLELPGLRGWDRVWGRIGVAIEGDAIADEGGEGSVGWRKPPGSGGREAEVIVGRTWTNVNCVVQ